MGAVEVVVDSEEMRLKAERQRITRMRAHLETALARLQQEKATFDIHKVQLLLCCENQFFCYL